MITKVTFPTNLVLLGHYKSIDLCIKFRLKRLPRPQLPLVQPQRKGASSKFRGVQFRRSSSGKRKSPMRPSSGHRGNGVNFRPPSRPSSPPHPAWCTMATRTATRKPARSQLLGRLRELNTALIRGEHENVQSAIWCRPAGDKGAHSQSGDGGKHIPRGAPSAPTPA